MTRWLHFNRVLAVFLGLNGIFWVWFWYEVARNAVPYVDRPPGYEELSPGYKFGGSALPWDSDVRLEAFRVLHVSQEPTLFVVGRIMASVQRDWSIRFGALSIGAWVLMATTLLSFLQWWLIGSGLRLVFGWVTRTRGRRPAACGTRSGENRSA
jgi:hypothetical protein